MTLHSIYPVLISLPRNEGVSRNEWKAVLILVVGFGTMLIQTYMGV